MTLKNDIVNMKNLKVLSIFILILIAIPATNLMAQRNASKTSSGRAAYGYPSLSKSKKKVKKKKSKPSKRKTKQPIDRKKSPWAG